jgi:hypothetical protein
LDRKSEVDAKLLALGASILGGVAIGVSAFYAKKYLGEKPKKGSEKSLAKEQAQDSVVEDIVEEKEEEPMEPVLSATIPLSLVAPEKGDYSARQKAMQTTGRSQDRQTGFTSNKRGGGDLRVDTGKFRKPLSKVDEQRYAEQEKIRVFLDQNVFADMAPLLRGAQSRRVPSYRTEAEVLRHAEAIFEEEVGFLGSEDQQALLAHKLFRAATIRDFIAAFFVNTSKKTPYLYDDEKEVSNFFERFPSCRGKNIQFEISTWKKQNESSPEVSLDAVLASIKAQNKTFPSLEELRAWLKDQGYIAHYIPVWNSIKKPEAANNAKPAYDGETELTIRVVFKSTWARYCNLSRFQHKGRVWLAMPSGDYDEDKVPNLMVEYSLNGKNSSKPLADLGKPNMFGGLAIWPSRLNLTGKVYPLMIPQSNGYGYLIRLSENGSLAISGSKYFSKKQEIEYKLDTKGGDCGGVLVDSVKPYSVVGFHHKGMKGNPPTNYAIRVTDTLLKYLDNLASKN